MTKQQLRQLYYIMTPIIIHYVYKSHAIDYDILFDKMRVVFNEIFDNYSIKEYNKIEKKMIIAFNKYNLSKNRYPYYIEKSQFLINDFKSILDNEVK